jgi:sterol desaturase/sphingolipid hydroxylase (fatty acid hydroxylase superfamily)
MKTHPYTPVMVFGSNAVVTIALVLIGQYATWKETLLLFVTGFLSWTLIEYLLHRFPFHGRIKSKALNLFLSGQHLFHHKYPNHPDYVVAPMAMAVPLYLLFLGVFRLLSGDAIPALILGAGLSVGYLIYEWLHYSAHHRPARTGVGRYLKRYHLIHHFKDSDNYFGVSSPFWDILFGTMPSYDPKKETSILPIASRERAVQVTP